MSRGFIRWIFSAGRVLDLTRKIILGFLFWVVVLGIIVGVLSVFIPVPRVEKGSILHLSLEGILTDKPSSVPDLFSSYLGGDSILVYDMIRVLDAARVDPKINGVWLQLDNLGSSGPSQTGELSEAIRKFKESGKPVVASSSSYNNQQYRLASSADVIVMDRLGDYMITGYGSWQYYYADILDQIGVDTYLFRSGKSKNAAENLTRSNMSDVARSDTERLLNDLWDEWLIEVSNNRQIPQIELRNWINNYDENLSEAGGNSSLSAQKRGLVDHIETGGVLDSILETQFGKNAPLIDAFSYINILQDKSKKPLIAIVPISGMLFNGRGYSGKNHAGSQDIVATILRASDQPNLASMVIRINSPGGGAQAAENIRRVLEKVREEKKIPLIVSMSDYAASGGYWIAVESDVIFSRPETITGSIGVFYTALDINKAFNRFGIGIDGIGTTPWTRMKREGMISINERTANIYAQGVQDVDNLFQSIVSRKRKMEPDVLRKLAGGIPWSGKRAVQYGLVDRIGGLSDAIETAAELAGLENWETQYFSPKTTVDFDLIRYAFVNFFSKLVFRIGTLNL